MEETPMKKFSTMACMKLWGNLPTPLAMMKCGAPTISEISKQYDNKTALELMGSYIKNLNDFLNIKTKMKEEQIFETSYLICRRFYYFNLAEISNIFADIKIGKYGKLYESIDGAKILSFFTDYNEERVPAAERMLKDQEAELKRLNYEKQQSRGDLITYHAAVKMGAIKPMIETVKKDGKEEIKLIKNLINDSDISA
jgi:hypothetical protein